MNKNDWYKYTLVFSILSLNYTVYLVSNSIHELPQCNSNNVGQENRNTIRDTIIKYVPDNLSIIGNLIYFEGDIVSYNKKISESYEYDTSFPEEIWRGNISVVKSKNDVKYLIWTKSPIDTSIVKIQGYFTKINDSKFGLDNNSEYSYLLLPVFSINF